MAERPQQQGMGRSELPPAGAAEPARQGVTRQSRRWLWLR